MYATGKLIHRVIPQQLEFYQSEPISDIVQSGHLEPLYPLAGARGSTTGPLTFFRKGNSDCIDLQQSYLILYGTFSGNKHIPASGSTPASTTLITDGSLQFAPVNNLAHSIWASCNISLNNTNITHGDQSYGYLAYLLTLCNSDKHIQDTYLQTCGWHKDTATKLNSLISTENDGFKERRAMMHNNESVALIMNIYSPLFLQGKNIIPFVDFELTLTRKSEPTFYMMHEREGKFIFTLDSAILMLQTVSPTPLFHETIEKMLGEKKEPIQYNLADTKINTINISSGLTNYNQDNIFNGKIPRHIVIGFVETAAFNGRADLNPFNFQHFDIQEIGLYKDGVEYPRPPLKIDFNNNKYVEAYHNLFSALGAINTPSPPNISLNDFKNGYTLFHWDLSPDQRGSNDLHALTSKSANIRLSLRFGTALAQPITVIILYELDTLVSINSSRQVTVQSG